MNKYKQAILKYKDYTRLDEIAKKEGLDVNGLYAALEELKAESLVDVKEEKEKIVVLTPEGKRALKEGLPEIRVVKKALEGVGVSDLDGEEKSVGLGWAKRMGLIEIQKGRIEVTEKGRSALKDYELTKDLKEGRPNEVLIKRGLQKLETMRKVLVRSKGELKEEEGVGALTHELIISGKWKDAKFRRYDVTLPGREVDSGRRHILRRFADRVRKIFVEMGFEEISGNLVESAFWNFDALFQPQDHPARELADTFYVKQPARMPIDAPPEIIDRVAREHETKWRYRWDRATAEQVVLRTHTTAVSARKLVEINQGKFFSIGRVFRNEAIDYKHLAEFHQIEGILAWNRANLRNLLWILREFYSKLGFEKIKFVPSYFPYTEPSLEIHAYFDRKKSWIELGGAGIFREEVSLPLMNSYPVLAWGLSLERVLMLLLDVDDIRIFYRNDLSEIKDRIREGGLEWLW